MVAKCACYLHSLLRERALVLVRCGIVHIVQQDCPFGFASFWFAKAAPRMRVHSPKGQMQEIQAAYAAPHVTPHVTIRHSR